MIADNVGVIANKVFALNDPSFEILWAGVFAFAIQIYADFSAYTDIARGTSRWLGFELTENFDHPYLARSPADFWRRWNISLSTWFRDYVYIPLGGSRAASATWARNVLVTFLLSGLWHGASWNYVLWGAVSRRAAGADARASNPGDPRAADRGRADASASLESLQIVGMFVLTLVGWLLFRETELIGHRARPDARRRGTARRSSARRGSTCSCWRSAIRFRCGRRASGSSCIAAQTAETSEPRWGRARAAGRRLRRGVRGDPRAAQPDVARLHLLPVLTLRCVVRITPIAGSEGVVGRLPRESAMLRVTAPAMQARRRWRRQAADGRGERPMESTTGHERESIATVKANATPEEGASNRRSSPARSR